MRAIRQKIKLLEAGGADQEDIISAKCKYKQMSKEYADFSEKMGLPEQRQRVYTDGLGTINAPKEEVLLTNAVGYPIIKVNKTTIKGESNSITQFEHKNGGIDRNYYDVNGQQFKQVSNNSHGHAKLKEYGKHGEHTHDYIYDDDGKLKARPYRELSEQERKENDDIL